MTTMNLPFSASAASAGNDPTSAMGYADLIKYYLSQWGLDTLAPLVTKLGKDSSNTSDSIYLQLQQTKEWQQRFAGNAERVKSGLAPLDPASYIALEAQYKSTLQQYGLPQGFYDSKAATDGWIGGDVSASEVAQRAQDAATLIYNSPPEALQAWNQYYGGTGTGGAIAAILDTKTAEPILQQQVGAAQIGGAALAQGLNTSQSNAEHFARQGVSLQQAQKAYSDIAGRLTNDKALSGRFGTDFGQQQEEQATLGQNAAAQQQQGTLYSEEASLFNKAGGASQTAGDSGANY